MKVLSVAVVVGALTAFAEQVIQKYRQHRMEPTGRAAMRTGLPSRSFTSRTSPLRCREILLR